jgi:hypothetical protein
MSYKQPLTKITAATVEENSDNISSFNDHVIISIPGVLMLRIKRNEGLKRDKTLHSGYQANTLRAENKRRLHLGQRLLNRRRRQWMN